MQRCIDVCRHLAQILLKDSSRREINRRTMLPKTFIVEPKTQYAPKYMYSPPLKTSPLIILAVTPYRITKG